LIEDETTRLQARLEGVLTALDPAMRAYGDALLAVVAGLAAEIEALRQRLAAQAEGAARRIRLDPLSHFDPARRLGPAILPAGAELAADDDGFLGFGWHPPEIVDGEACRYSGAGTCASIRLPAVAPGRVRITLRLRGRHGHVTPEQVLALLDGLPLSLAESGDALSGMAVLDAPEGGLHVLVLQLPLETVPGPDGTPRQIGPGLTRLTVEAI